jgi:hypothetical protein
MCLTVGLSIDVFVIIAEEEGGGGANEKDGRAGSGATLLAMRKPPQESLTHLPPRL